MSHEVETMAFRHEVPWHGLGNQLTQDATPFEMMQEAGCDWLVEKRPIGYKHSSGNIQKITGKNALIRASDERFFSIVGDNWKPVQNSQIFEVFNKFCVEGGATMETAGALQGGKLVWALANLNKAFVAANGEPIKAYMLLAHKHEYGFASIGRLTNIVVVCANTFAQSGGFKGASSFRVPHTVEFEPNWAAEQFNIMREGSTEFERNVNILTKINISTEDAVRILAPVFQPDIDPDDLVKDFDNKVNRTVLGIMKSALIGAGADLRRDTAWGLFNGVTYYENHLAKGTKDSRLASTFMGTNNANMNKIYTKLLELQ